MERFQRFLFGAVIVVTFMLLIYLMYVAIERHANVDIGQFDSGSFR